MPEDLRVLQLLEEALSSGRSPEEVCAESPDLLTAVRARWEHCRLLDAQLQAFFPSALTAANARRTVPEKSGLAAEFTSIPGYVIETELGRGGVGVVFGARHLELRRPVALKMLLSGAYAGRVERARFTREAQAVAALRHAHVVQIHDIGEHEGRPFFTMELMEGGSLANRLGGVPQPAREAAELLIAIAGAVQEAHRTGIVHRDLKPANVLLTADGTPKVSDFGLAQQEAPDDLALTLSGARVGTPCYMAPEQASGRRSAVGPSSDIYALGAILYEMLTGRPPFQGESAAETERQVICEDPAPPSRLNARVPRDLETICLTCLAKDSRRRYASAAALADDLGRFSRGEPIAARPTGRVERVAKWVRRRPATATLWSGGALLAVAAFAGALSWATDRAATALAVTEDLREAQRMQHESRWAEANTILDRATFRLGDRRLADVRTQLNRARREADLVPRLEMIRTDRVNMIHGSLASRQADQEYAEVFREAGIADGTANPAAAGARVRDSDVRPALVAALYDWMRCTRDVRRNRWLLSVVQLADPDPTGWRDRVLDPANWRNPTTADAIASDPALAARTPELLLVVNDRLRNAGHDSTPFLVRIQLAHPGDFWVNLDLGHAMSDAGNFTDAIRYGQVAVALRPQVAIAHHYLGNALGDAGRLGESIAELREALRIEPDSPAMHGDLGTRLAAAGNNEEAVGELEASVREGNNDFSTPATLGGSLEALGRLDDAARNYQQVILEYRRLFVGAHIFAPPATAQQSYLLAQRRMRAILINQGRSKEALTGWWTELDTPASPEDRVWSGYADCCLYCGDVAEYHRVCQLLLDQAEASRNPRVWEVVGRTCLLQPPNEPDLRRATALIDRALATTRDHRGLYFYFLAAKALAECRGEHPENAVTIMEGEAAPVLGPMPQLVIAIAQSRLGRPVEARLALARATIIYDWRPGNADAADAWLYHVLRSEAEAMILPNLHAYLESHYEPADADERMAMTGACQFRELNVAHARLWAESFDAQPTIAAHGGRERAVPAAALAGCGIGKDAAALTATARARWRIQACDWFRGELVDAVADASTTAGMAGRTRARAILAGWWVSADLAGVRDPTALARLPATERQAWASVWQQAAMILKQPR